MDKKTRPFRLGQQELAKMLSENRWRDGLRRVTFTKDPDWVGFVRNDGTGLALENPSHLEMLALQQSMAGNVTSTVDERSLWGV